MNFLFKNVYDLIKKTKYVNVIDLNCTSREAIV